MKGRKKGNSNSPEIDVLNILFGNMIDVHHDSLETPPGAVAVGYDEVVENDGSGNYTPVQIVYFTNAQHTEELGDIEYFDEREDAERFGRAFAQKRGLRYVGRYDADDERREDEPRSIVTGKQTI